MRIDLVKLFCNIHDFWMNFENQWNQILLAQGKRSPRRLPCLHPSEVMTIIILFHISGFRCFKNFYNGYILRHLHQDFPKCPSYQRFVELKKSNVFPLYCYLISCMGQVTGISFVDSTSLEVCHPKRIGKHKVFKGLAMRGKTSMGWFFGFKVHLIVNDVGELLAFSLTPGNIDDRKPVPALVEGRIIGLLFGDRGYISVDLAEKLREYGVQLITRLRSNMKNKLMPLMDKLLLRKRGIVETIIDQLKNISQIEHSRHRSPVNFVVNLLGGLIAYCHQPKKPSLNLSENESNSLMIC
jgi:DDE family transposase